MKLLTASTLILTGLALATGCFLAAGHVSAQSYSAGFALMTIGGGLGLLLVNAGLARF